MSKHTPEPWNNKRIDIAVHYFESINAEIAFTGKSDESMANSSRIIACVNACAGMADPDAEIAELKRQRDELLAAMKTIANSEEFHGDSFICDFDSQQSVARASIAKAKGGAA